MYLKIKGKEEEKEKEKVSYLTFVPTQYFVRVGGGWSNDGLYRDLIYI